MLRGKQLTSQILPLSWIRKNVPELKSDIKQTKFRRKKSAAPKLVAERLFIRTIWVSFCLARPLRNALIVVSCTLSDTLKKKFCIVFCIIVTNHTLGLGNLLFLGVCVFVWFFFAPIFHRLYFICLCGVWMRRSPFPKVIILSHYGYSIIGFFSLLISIWANSLCMGVRNMCGNRTSVHRMSTLVFAFWTNKIKREKKYRMKRRESVRGREREKERKRKREKKMLTHK